MVRVNPLRAVRPLPEHAARVASVPYDVVDRAEARALSKDNPLSFLHVVRPDADLPDSIGAYDDRVYALAKSNFNKLIADGILFQDTTPCVYVYRQEMTLGDRVLAQTGVVACCHVDDYARDRIKRHEKTRKDKEDDRTRHVLALNANAGPVFLLHKDEHSIARLIAARTKSAALYDFMSPDGVRHTVWRVTDHQPFIEAYAKLPAAYVADGHHRAASAARAGAERRSLNPRHSGEEEYNWFLACLFPATELNILPYHRVVIDLGGMTPQQLLHRISAIARVEPEIDPLPRAPGCFGMYLDGQWYSITLPEPSIDRHDPIASLDYELLAQRILEPMLGIADVRTDKRIDFVGGIRGPGELQRRVDQSGGVAFAMHPVTIDQLIAVADAGAIMPPKSTWFEPKLRSGLVVHLLD